MEGYFGRAIWFPIWVKIRSLDGIERSCGIVFSRNIHSSNFFLSASSSPFPQFSKFLSHFPPLDSSVRIYGKTVLKLALKGSIILPGETPRERGLRDLMGASPDRYGTRFERRIPVCRCTRSLTRVYLAGWFADKPFPRAKFNARSSFLFYVPDYVSPRLASPLPLEVHARTSLSLSLLSSRKNRFHSK